MKPSEFMPNTIELTSQDMGVLLDALQYCEEALPQLYPKDELEALKELEGEPAPIVIVGDSARIAIGAFMLLSEERTEEGDMAKQVLASYLNYSKKRSNLSTPA